MAHILPFGQARLVSLRFLSAKPAADGQAECVRTAFDPHAFGAAKPASWRVRSTNHPSNLLTLSPTAEKLFDSFRLVVDPLVEDHPKVFHISTTARNTLPDRILHLLLDPEAPFPRLPFEIAGVPGPSPTCLLAHLMAALAHSCRLRMSWEKRQDEDAGRDEQHTPSPELVAKVVEWMEAP